MTRVPHSLVALVTCSIVAACAPAVHAQSADRLTAVSGIVDILEGETLTTQRWSLNPDLDPDVLTVQLADPDESRRVCFLSGANALCRLVSVGDTFDLVIEYDGVDHPTRIVGAPPAAVFDEAYREAHRGKITVLVPEVYELVNVAIALTTFIDGNPRVVYTDSEYHDAVMAHFGDFADHPFVSWLNEEMTRSRAFYSRHKMSGYAFEFDDEGRIVGSPIYNSTNFPGVGNSLLPVVEEMQSFADDSDFRTFFAAHHDVYDDQTAFLRDSLDSERMLAWLQREFPGRSAYDHVKVVFSPLVYGWQSVTWFETDGFSELQPHINFPYPPSDPDGYAPESITLRRGNLLFTEINHGFINPTADPYADQIGDALSNRAKWAQEGTAAESYGGALPLFNEMMNWGLIELYYLDHAPPADLDRLIEQNRISMRESRGFTLYPEFADHLVELYRSRPEGTTIADLYPQIIAWVAERDAPTG